MVEETGLKVLEFLKENNLYKEFLKGGENTDFASVSALFAEQYPDEDQFEARYAMEYLAGKTDIFHYRRIAKLKGVAKEYGKNKHR